MISLEEPTQAMISEAASGGFYDSPWGSHPRVQIVTVEELLDGAGIDYPPVRNVTHRRAPRHVEETAEQMELAGNENQ